jgi:hypothetical protein
MSTYPINYDETGFFSSNMNIIATIPFSLPAVIDWAKQAPNRPLTPNDAMNIGDVLDSKLSDVITNPGNKDDFVNIFLPGNIYLNSDFGKLTVSTDKITSNSYTPGKVKISGIDYDGTQVTGEKGNISFLLGTPGSQRVVYQPICTVNHLHYPEGCSVQQVINSTTKTSYYKCVCQGTPVFNSQPHSHCQSFTNAETDPKLAIQKAYSNKGTMNSKMSDSTKSRSSNSTSGNTFDVNYENADNLNDTDRLIREAIYQYYYEVVKNIKYKNDLKSNKTISDTANQALHDSSVKYKNQYLSVFNLFSGIVIVCGYLFAMNK